MYVKKFTFFNKKKLFNSGKKHQFRTVRCGIQN